MKTEMMMNGLRSYLCLHPGIGIQNGMRLRMSLLRQACSGHQESEEVRIIALSRTTPNSHLAIPIFKALKVRGLNILVFESGTDYPVFRGLQR